MKFLQKVIISFFIFIAATQLTFADNSTIAANQLAKLLGQMVSIQGKFKQTVTNGKGQVIQSSSGTMIMQKPNKFRWQVNAPNPQLIISDGKNLWVYNPRLQQASVQPLKKNLAATPALLLDATASRIKYYFNVTQQNGWFYLSAKNNNNMFSQIKLLFNGNILQQMQLTDNLGQSGQLQFISLHVNAPVAANAFQFTPPAGVDVINQSSQ